MKRNIIISSLLIILISCFFLTTTFMSAYDKDDLKQLIDTNECEGCDLSGANLTGLDLSGANLRNADLSKANLGGRWIPSENRYVITNLSYADFTDANLSYANLTSANLKGAILKRSRLRGAVASNVILTEANITTSNLIGAVLTGANLTNASVINSYVSYANLIGINLTGANLTGTDFTETYLSDANLTGANLTGTNLTGTDFTNSILKGVNITDATITAATIGMDIDAIQEEIAEDELLEEGVSYAETNIIKKVSIPSENLYRIYYYRPDNDYEDWGIHLWNDGGWNPTLWNTYPTFTAMPEEFVDFGCGKEKIDGLVYRYIEFIAPTVGTNINFIIHKFDKKELNKENQLWPNPTENRVIKVINADNNIYTINTPLKRETYRIYYHRPDENYIDWGIHLWNNKGWELPITWGEYPKFRDVKGFENFKSGGTMFGGFEFKYIDIPKPNKPEILFIIHKENEKDMDGSDQTWPILNRSIFIMSNETEIFNDPNKALQTLRNDLVKARFLSKKEAEITLKYDYNNEKVSLFKDGKEMAADFTPDGNKLLISCGDREFDFSEKYSVSFNGTTEKYLRLEAALMDTCPDFTPENPDDIHLGVIMENNYATFRLWAPTATNVILNFYSYWDQENDYADYSYEMLKTENGIWETTVEDVQIGQLYQYELHFGNTVKRALDPYAKSMAMFNDQSSSDNIGKGVVVDPKVYDPEGFGFADIENYNSKKDAVIYEVHVRDFTSDPSITTTAQFGTYNAFVEKLDYLEELGITHIQLLPVLSYYYGDETRNNKREMVPSAKNNNYNWGYDPHNYFSPEGMYSEDPENPVLRIIELKNLINEIHKRGMGVILDVVYNHTAKEDILDNLVPDYYYRLDEMLRRSADSGCGNDVATNHKMARKLIVDSVKYWVEEYKVDGFRFDLMGLIDAETINKAYTEAAAINPDLLFLGEGWRMYSGKDNIELATQDWMNKTDNVAVFSDSFRDILKGGGLDEDKLGFLLEEDVNIQTLFNEFMGKPSNFENDNPIDCVQYIEAHDNLTFHDKIIYNLELDFDIDKEEIYNRLKLGNFAVLTAQGIPFLHAGQEMGRTKVFDGTPSDGDFNEMHGEFVSNSYDSSDAINHLKWKWVSENGRGKELLEYTKGLIALRKSTNAFKLDNRATIDSNVTLFESDNESDYFIAYKINANDGTYYVIMNTDMKRRTIDVDDDLSDAVILVDNLNAGTEPILEPVGVVIEGNAITVNSMSAAIVKTANTDFSSLDENEFEITFENDGWWNDAIFYQIWPRSFYDTDNDGNGDFKGLTEKLDYLAELGISGIWLTPMFDAPSYHGYDFVGFYDVEEDYGTMEDFEEFLTMANEKGIKVIADLVLNHISSKSEWFENSIKKVEPYTDFFIWRDDVPEGWGKPWADPTHPEWGYNKPEWVWIWNEERGQYYYAAFDGSQPDLNLTNPQVVEKLKDITKYWIEKGFDGFRLDAIRYAIEEGPYPLQADVPTTINFWKDYVKFVKSIDPEIMLVGEVWADIDTISKYYANGKGMDLCFDFEFGNDIINILNSDKEEDEESGFGNDAMTGLNNAKAVIENIRKKTSGNAPINFYSPFLTNHDQNRLMYQVGDDIDKAKLAGVLLLTNIGTPYIYYGEEIGMSQYTTGDDQYKRAPMQWDNSDYAGFTKSETLWLDDGKWFPWIGEHQPWWKTYWDNLENKLNVEDQQNDPNSMLNLYKSLIRIRTENPEFTEDGFIKFFNTKNDNVIAFRRRAKQGEEVSSLVIANLSVDETQKITIDYMNGKVFKNLINNEIVEFSNGEIELTTGQFYILKEIWYTWTGSKLGENSTGLEIHNEEDMEEIEEEEIDEEEVEEENLDAEEESESDSDEEEPYFDNPFTVAVADEKTPVDATGQWTFYMFGYPDADGNKETLNFGTSLKISIVEEDGKYILKKLNFELPKNSLMILDKEVEIKEMTYEGNTAWGAENIIVEWHTDTGALIGLFEFSIHFDSTFDNIKSLYTDGKYNIYRKIR